MNDIVDSARFDANNSCDAHKRSTEELTAKLFIKLQSDGSLNQLSPDLRQKLVEYLRNVKKNDDKRSQTDDLTPKHPLEACNWLVSEHLLRNGYRSTLSVFLIECERPNRTFFNITDILTFIGIDLLTVEATRIVSEYVDRNSKQLLWRFLTSNTRKAERSELVSRAIQTECGDETEIEAKLRQLDAVYSKRKADLILKKQPIEENLSLFERISTIGYEFRNGTGSESKVGRFRGAEDVRTTEKEDYWRAVEDRFRSRLEGLIARERDATDALDKQKINIEEELYRQRQRILSDVSSLKQRQDDWNEKKSRQENDLRIRIESLDRFEREVENRETALREREKGYEEHLSEQKEQLAIEEKRRYEERIENVEIREKEIEDKRKRLFDLEQSLEATRTKYDEAATRSAKLQSELEDSRREVALLSGREKQEVVLLKEEVQRLREYLKDEQVRRADVMRTANERADRQHAEMVALKLEFDRLNDERLREQRRYEIEIQKANETAKSFADRLNQQYRHIAVLNENIESLQRNVKGQRFVPGNSAEVTPTKRPLKNDSFLSAAIDLNGTYFDTTLNATRLPPELELESRDHDDDDLSFIEDARSRIRALEYEAEALENRYRTLKRNDPFSTLNLTYFQPESRLRSPERRNTRFEARSLPSFVTEREVSSSTLRDPRQEVVFTEAVLRSEKKASLESISKPIDTGVRDADTIAAVPRVVEPITQPDQVFESDRDVGLVVDSVPLEESVSQAAFATAKIIKAETEMASNAKPSNLGSTINLDSMWQRDDDSKSLEDSSSVGEGGGELANPAPMSSTPYVMRSGKNLNRDDTRTRLELESKGDNEEDINQEIDISGGITDEELPKDDFEW